eukprot:2730706-Rhodomonas_salina.2
MLRACYAISSTGVGHPTAMYSAVLASGVLLPYAPVLTVSTCYCYGTCGTHIAHICYAICGTAWYMRYCMVYAVLPWHTLQNQIPENTISVQFVPGMRFLVFDFAAYVVLILGMLPSDARAVMTVTAHLLEAWSLVLRYHPLPRTLK